MTPAELAERLARARELLREIHHIALATTNADDSPHCSPVFAAHDHELHFFWASNPQPQHSQNIARTGLVFISIFDSREGHGGLHIRARAHEISDPASLRQAYELYAQAAEHKIGELRHYASPGPERLYEAVPQAVWVNKSDRDDQGVIVRDRRHEISLGELQEY